MKSWFGLGSTSIDAVTFIGFGWHPVTLAQSLDQDKSSAPSRVKTAASISRNREAHLIMRAAQKWNAPHVAKSYLAVNRKSEKAWLQELARQQVAAMRSLVH